MNKPLRIVLVSIASVLFLVVLVFVISILPGSIGRVEAVADQFQPNPEWYLEDDMVVPPQILCLTADCNRVVRTWRLERNITTEEFKEVIRRSGWGDMIKGDIECTTKEGFTSSFGQTMCEVSGVRNGFDVTVLARGNHGDNENAAISLWVKMGT